MPERVTNSSIFIYEIRLLYPSCACWYQRSSFLTFHNNLDLWSALTPANWVNLQNSYLNFTTCGIMSTREAFADRKENLPSSHGVSEAVASGSSSHYTLKGIPHLVNFYMLETFEFPPLNAALPRNHCSRDWTGCQLSRIKNISLQTTSLCKKWPCKRGLCIFSKLTGLALGFASLHALVSSAAECQVSHLSILLNNSPKLHLLDQ